MKCFFRNERKSSIFKLFLFSFFFFFIVDEEMYMWINILYVLFSLEYSKKPKDMSMSDLSLVKVLPFICNSLWFPPQHPVK